MSTRVAVPDCTDISMAKRRSSLQKRLNAAPPIGHVVKVNRWCSPDPLEYYPNAQELIEERSWWLLQVDIGDPSLTFMVGTPKYTRAGKPKLDGDWEATCWVYDVEPASTLTEHKATVDDNGITCTCGWERKFARKPSIVFDAYAKHLAEHAEPVFESPWAP